MNRASIRRWLSFCVLFIAGLASLATTQAPPSIEADRSGSTVVGADGSDLRVRVKLTEFEANSFSPRGRVQLDLSGAPGQFELTSSTQESEISRTDPQAFSIALTTADCEASCEFSYEFHITLTDPSAAPVTVPWHLNAYVIGSGEIALEVEPLESNRDLLEGASSRMGDSLTYARG